MVHLILSTYRRWGGTSGTRYTNPKESPKHYQEGPSELRNNIPIIFVIFIFVILSLEIIYLFK